MLGAIIGDIVGSTREWHNIKTEDFELVPKGSHFTDDTVMTLAVAEWLMTDPTHQRDTLVECMQRLGRSYPHAGYGGMFAKWLASDDPQPYGSYGNGSAMRVSPVGLYAHSMEEAMELAEITASVSHNHPEGIKGAQAIAGCVYLKKNYKGYEAREKIIHFITEKIGYDLCFRLGVLRPEYGFDVTCQGSVPIAIQAYLERYNETSENALRLAISMGGDSDTIGAMTASIVGIEADDTYIHGFSKDLIEQCRRLLPADLLDINDRFEDFIRSKEKTYKERTRDRIRGSMIAGAIGDALGYPVEFMSRQSILEKYGREGITQFDLSSEGKALISDDTQMTLFTANGLLLGITRAATHGVSGTPVFYVSLAYLDWYYTQTKRERRGFMSMRYTWLRDLSEMAYCRAPGNTCLTACESILRGHKVCNHSKGCGGIMRVAPVALLMAGYYSRKERFYTINEMDESGAYIAYITHKHPLGFLPAALLTDLIFRLTRSDTRYIKAHIADIAVDAIHTLDTIYEGKYEEYKRVLSALSIKAVKLAMGNQSDAENIRILGEGWTGEEAWAIALYCAIRHIDSIEAALIAAVNHDGDSDSTGAICGNIMGAIYGYEAIKRANLFCPRGKKLENTLELHDIILALSDDLYTSCIIGEHIPIDTPEKRQWEKRYCLMLPAGIKVEKKYNRAFTPEKVSQLKQGEIFVFGSNLEGAHLGGAARLARHRFGAIMGQGVGMQGKSYAIPTMQGGVETIKSYVDEFIHFAQTHPYNTFLVTQIGCGIAGFSVSEIAPLFKEAIGVENIILPKEFVETY